MRQDDNKLSFLSPTLLFRRDVARYIAVLPAVN